MAKNPQYWRRTGKNYVYPYKIIKIFHIFSHTEYFGDCDSISTSVKIIYNFSNQKVFQRVFITEKVIRLQIPCLFSHRTLFNLNFRGAGSLNIEPMSQTI